MKPFRTLMLARLFALVSIGTVLAQPAETGAEAAAEPQAAAQTQAQAQTEQGEPNIYPWLAAGLIERGVAVIDVRSAEEVAETGVLANAVNIPHTDTEALIEFIGEDRGRTVVLYCSSGRRVARVIDSLRERGYHGLVNAGGYRDLAEAIDQP